jgi:hypothetical protein
MNQPVPSDWNAVDFRRVIAQALLPAFKVNRAAERGEHYKLGKGNTGTLCQFLGSLEGIWTVGRESAENMHTVFLKLPKSLHQPLARYVKVLENCLEPSAVTASTPTSAPIIRALRIASRKSGSSAASIVIWVKNTIPFGSSARRSMSSNRSA